MGETKIYISGEDGLTLLNGIKNLQLTLPKCEQVIEKTNPAEPFSITLHMKVSDETLRQIEEWNREFEQEREQAIKDCAEHCGVTEDEIRQMLEQAEKEMGFRMKPVINSK